MKIETVTGPISPEKSGITMVHEHILIYGQHLLYEEPTEPTKNKLWNSPISIDILGSLRRGTPNKDNLILDDEESVAKELIDFKKWGGKTIIENSNWGLGRDVLGLRRISYETGVNIIATTGFYKNEVHPQWMKKMTADQLSDFMTKEIEEGIGETGIKAGSIGECACTEPVPYHPEEKKVLEAACRTQKTTDVGFTFHPSIYDSKTKSLVKTGQVYIDLIKKEDANLEKFYLSHVDLTIDDLDYHRRLMDNGITIAYDSFGCEGINDYAFLGGFRMPTDLEKINAIAILCQEGYDKQIVVSHDVGCKIRWKRYGGDGYSFIMEYVIPILKSKDVKDNQIQNMLINNPRKILTVK